MMKHHRPDLKRTLGGAAAVALLASATLTLGSPGIAHPHPEGERKQQRIVVVEKGGDHARAEGATREFRIRRGENGELALPEDCREGGELFNLEERDGDHRTRFVLCARGAETPAARAEILELARERLAENTHLSDEQRARVTAALDREIARLQGQ